MNKIKFSFQIYLLAFIISSCSQKEVEIKGSYNEILIDNSKIEELHDISDIVDEISILPLKETKGNYLGDIEKLYISNSKYIAADLLSTHKINLYDSAGTFIKTIIKTGDAPNDALQINDCWVNYKDELEVYDFAQKKIFQFDSSFTLKKIIKSDALEIFNSVKRIPQSDNYVGYTTFNTYNPLHNGEMFHIAILNEGLNILHTDLYFDKSFQGIPWLSYNEHFYPYKDTLRFVQSYDNFIYNVTKTGISKRYKLLYKTKPLPDDVMNTIVKQKLELYKSKDISPNEKASYLKDYTRFDGLWLENDKYVYINSRDGEGKFGNYFFTLIDKKNNNTSFNTRNVCETKKYKLLLPPFQFYSNKTSEFISVTSGEVLKRIIYGGSSFLEGIIDDPEIFYIIKVKLR